MENIGEERRDVVSQIRMGEAEDQESERAGEDDLIRPTIGRQPVIPDERKQEYVAIRARPTYKKRVKSVSKAIKYLEMVTNNRQLFDANDELQALGNVSRTTFAAMAYIEEQIKENDERKGLLPREPNKGNDDEEGGKGNKRSDEKSGGRQISLRQHHHRHHRNPLIPSSD